MKKIVFISNNGYQRETRSDQLLEHLAFLLARLAVRLNGTPQSILKVFIVTGLLLAAHKKNELTLSKDKLFNKFQKRKKMLIHQRLSTHTSPDVISQELIREHNIQVSESTIYRYIYDDRERGGELYKNLPHSGKPYKKKVSRGDQTKIPNRVGIEQRPAIADEKTEFGHFEIDTVVGRDHQSYLLTLVDKANKMCCIRKMPNKQAKTVINTFMNVVGSTFFDFKTITSDNGTEFAGHEAISKITEADFYFARPYRSCDRGLNEHTNGLIRRFLPKGTDFNEVSDKEIAKIEHTLNTRRRASLNYRSPNHVFLEYLMAA